MLAIIIGIFMKNAQHVSFQFGKLINTKCIKCCFEKKYLQN